MIYYVYALRSLERNYIYVGMTNDVNRRVEEHNKGYNKTTKPYSPFVLIFSVRAGTRAEGRKLEKYYKSSSGKKYLRELDWRNKKLG